MTAWISWTTWLWGTSVNEWIKFSFWSLKTSEMVKTLFCSFGKPPCHVSVLCTTQLCRLSYASPNRIRFVPNGLEIWFSLGRQFLCCVLLAKQLCSWRILWCKIQPVQQVARAALVKHLRYQTSKMYSAEISILKTWEILISQTRFAHCKFA